MNPILLSNKTLVNTDKMLSGSASPWGSAGLIAGAVPRVSRGPALVPSRAPARTAFPTATRRPPSATSWRRGGALLNVLVIVLVVVGLALVFSPCVYRPISRSALAEAMNNVRQVKFALDGFATDFDGQFPNSVTGRMLDSGGSEPRFSNDYFRQLFAAEETRSERIFWVHESPVAAGEAPDDQFATRETTLAAGEVHWAYVTGQRNDSVVTRPLVLDPFIPGTTRFDENLWDRKVIVLTIDGSAKARRMRLSDGKVLDADGNDILSFDAKAWRDSDVEPHRLLVQPERKGGMR